MKKFKLILLTTLLLFSLSSCKTSLSTTTHDSLNSTSTLPQSAKTITDIKPLEDSDFIVSDGTNSIELDSIYSDFIPSKPEDQIENNLVSEAFNGDWNYQIYTHDFPDYTLYDADYKVIDQANITQITLITSIYQTARGISIGSSADEINKLYGDDWTKKQEEENGFSLSYQYKDKNIVFYVDGSNTITSILLSIYIDN